MSDDDNVKKDLTRLEDLSEFEHVEDPEINAQLETYQEPNDKADASLPEPPSFDFDDDENDSSDDFGSDSDNDFVSVSEDSSSDEVSSDDDWAVSSSDDFASEDDFSSNDDFSSEPSSLDDDDDWSIGEVENSDFDTNEETDFSSEDHEILSEIGGGDFNLDEEDEDEDSEEESIEIPISDSGFDLEDEPDFEPVAELAPALAPALEPVAELSPAPGPVSEPAPEPPKKENFEDVIDYGKSISPVTSSAPGNPPYTILIKNITYQDEGDEILRILSEFGVMKEADEDTYRKSIEMGHVLISQLSEFLAIQICHKLRHHSFDMQFGLSEKIHPSDLYSEEDRGLINRSNITQNKTKEYSKRPVDFTIEDILLSTTPALENHQILEYKGILTEHLTVNEYDLLEKDPESELEKRISSWTEEIKELLSDDLMSESKVVQKYQGTLVEMYDLLAKKLRDQAFDLEANAIVNINYQLTPLVNYGRPSDTTPSENRYKITCTGNAVVAKEL